jgi:hypothetical protein
MNGFGDGGFSFDQRMVNNAPIQRAIRVFFEKSGLGVEDWADREPLSVALVSVYGRTVETGYAVHPGLGRRAQAKCADFAVFKPRKLGVGIAVVNSDLHPDFSFF